MGQGHEHGALGPGDDVAGAAQATANCLADAAQARISGVLTENFDICIEFVERKRYQGEPALFAGRDRPVVLEYFPKCRSVQKTGDHIVT